MVIGHCLPRFIYRAAVLSILHYVVFTTIVMTDIIAYKPGVLLMVIILLEEMFIVLGVMFIVLGIIFIILLKIINEMGCWYIILLVIVSITVYIIAIDVVLVMNIIILFIHEFAAIEISKITLFILALRSR